MKNNSVIKALKAIHYALITTICLYSATSKSNNHKSTAAMQQQTINVSGKITDNLAPMAGVSITIKGKNTTTNSDYNGQYTIAAHTNDILVFYFMGFKKIEIPINKQKIINVQLQEEATTLQEVKINAGYYSVKESERTGSIARITAKDIETQPVTNVLATMQGRMAGVSITQTTGVPGGGFDIKIRGQNSLRAQANDPLYIIDGVPISSESIGSYYTGTTFPTLSSPLNSINPETIESIEVLKDADATSIYGSRGANGVVLITTKKGKAGKTKFFISTSTGAGNVTKFIKLMNTQQYLTMRKKAFLNDGITTYNPWDYDVNGTWDPNRYTDWQKELIGGTAQITDLQGSVSGGSGSTQFLASGSYHTESTVFPGSFKYKKGGSRISLNHNSDDQKFNLSFSAGFNTQSNDQPSYDFTHDARTLPPNAPALYKVDGTLNWENGTWQNPLRNLNTKFQSKTNNWTANTVLSYEITTGLAAKGNFGYTNLNNNDTRIIPSTIYNPEYQVSSARSVIFSNTTNRSSWIIEPQLSWEKDLESSKIDILLGSTFQNQQTSQVSQSGTGFTSNSLIYNFAAAKSTRVMLNDETIYKYQAFFGRVNYNYQQRYIINLTARRDGSSRFGPGNQFANFGAVGLAWVFSKETFMHRTSWLSFGKLRASFGTTGNDQIGDYQFLDTYSNTGVIYNGTAGLSPTRLFNPDFGWEVNKKLEAAIEIGFLQDRIFTTIAGYQNRSSNQLVGFTLPGSTGFTSYQANLDATVQNTGLEFTLRTINISSSCFSWTTNLNLTFAKNKLLHFPGLESSTYKEQYRIGKPLNIELLYKFMAVNPQTGIYSFEDLNKDGQLTFPEDKQTIVDLNPKYYGGLQNELIYKRLSLDFLFQLVKQKNRTYPMGPAGMMSNQQQKMTNSWTKETDQAPYQLYTTGYNYDALNGDYLYYDSTASFTDASFIRLKNISLSYDLPIESNNTQCKITIQAQNLITLTKYKEGDPEFTSYGFLPTLKVLTAGIQLTF